MLNGILLLLSIIIFVCVFLNNVSNKFGIPVLLVFLMLGVFVGREQDIMNQAQAVSDTCTIALIFIMFYGGFGTSWKSARPIAVQAGILATVGVLMTAVITGAFCIFVLHWDWKAGMLLGAVLSSTDAASVFSILRSKRLGLKNHTAPMLEVESGSNDPMSYMLTAIMISIISGTASAGAIVWEIIAQMVFGAGGGLLIAQGTLWVLRRIKFASSGFDMLFMGAVAVISYALPSLIGGNGYLSTYIVGIVLGNAKLTDRKQLVNFFDGITSLTQIIIFFLLGFMVNAERFLSNSANWTGTILPAIAVMFFMLLVARPISVFAILAPFKKYSFKQMTLISFVGLRGAASIVFAILAMIGAQGLIEVDIFSMVFCIVVLSISLQGSFIPLVAKKLDMIDKSDVMKTFTDFSDESEMQFGRIRITEESSWCNREVMNLNLPKEMLLTLILRGKERIVPNGSTVLLDGDEAIISTLGYTDEEYTDLREHPISKNSKWIGRKLKEYPSKPEQLVVMIRRGDKRVVPNGDTVFKKGDVLVIMDRNYAKVQ